MLARHLFLTLEKSSFYGKGTYLVLNDCNFVRYIIAPNDEEAIRQFENYVKEIAK